MHICNIDNNVLTIIIKLNHIKHSQALPENVQLSYHPQNGLRGEENIAKLERNKKTF